GRCSKTSSRTPSRSSRGTSGNAPSRRLCSWQNQTMALRGWRKIYSVEGRLPWWPRLGGSGNPSFRSRGRRAWPPAAGFLGGVVMARGGVFGGEAMKPVKVLLVDRDNPEPIIKERLRAWGAEHAPNLRVLTRADAPSLTDRDTWASFPVEDYDVLIIDAVGS